ncbi:TPA: ATP-binding protein [Vibrio cholerae]
MIKQKFTRPRVSPSSGKSTYAKTINAVLIDIFLTDRNDVDQCDPKCIKHVPSWSQLETMQLLRAEFDVVVSNTVLKNRESLFYKLFSDEFEILFVLAEMKGQYVNTHGVSDSVITRMSKQFEKLKHLIFPSRNTNSIFQLFEKFAS